MESAPVSVEKPSASRWTLIVVLAFSYLYPILYYLFAGSILRQQPVIRYFGTIVSAIILGAVGLWGLRRDGIPLAEIGFQWKRLPQALLLILATWLIMALAYFVIAGGDGLKWIADPADIIQQWLFVGLGEELLYRGYLLHRLLRAFSNLKKLQANLLAIFLTSFFFSTMHIPVRLFNGFALSELWLSLVLVFLLSVFFCSYILRARNILFNGLIHGSWNVPLMGSQGDFMLLVVALVVVEVNNLIRRFLQKSQPQIADSV